MRERRDCVSAVRVRIITVLWTVATIEVAEVYMTSYEIVMIVITSVTLVLALIEATKGNKK